MSRRVSKKGCFEVMSYINFILANARFLSFGALLTFFGNFGQTYYIALFNAPIRADYGLTHGDIRPRWPHVKISNYRHKITKENGG